MAEGQEYVSGDDNATCGLCGAVKSLASIVEHLVIDHGIDRAELLRASIVDTTDEELLRAPIVDATDEERP